MYFVEFIFVMQAYYGKNAEFIFAIPVFYKIFSTNSKKQDTIYMGIIYVFLIEKSTL